MAFFVRPFRGGGFEYDIKIKWPSGETLRERRKSPHTSESATRRYAEQRERNLYDAGPPSEIAPMFEVFAERWIREYDEARRHKPSTIKTKRVILGSHLKCFNGRRIDTITEADVSRLQQRMAAAKLSPKTTNNVLSVLSKMLKTAAKWNEIKRAPTVELVRHDKKRMPFTSVENYDRLIAGAATLKDRRALVAILLAGDAGLRKGEITALRWECVDLKRGVIAVQESEVNGIVSSTKGRNWRMVPVTKTLHAALAALPHRTGRVVKGRTRNGGIERKTLTALVIEAEKAAKLEPTGLLHILRHSYASHLAIAGASIYHLQAAMGHQDSATTQDYAKLTAEALRPLAAAIDARRAQTLGDQGETNPTAPVTPRIDKAKKVEAVGIEPSFDRSGQDPDTPEE